MTKHPAHFDPALPPLRNASGAMPASMLYAILLIPSLGLAADTTVYRCTALNGETEFRQRPCEAGSKEEELTLEDRETGWVPPAGDPGLFTKQPDKERPPRKRAPKSGPNKAKREERCWNKRKLLEEVNWRLRRGYKAGTGVKLRRRRRTYEEYIGRYCK